MKDVVPRTVKYIKSKQQSESIEYLVSKAPNSTKAINKLKKIFDEAMNNICFNYIKTSTKVATEASVKG